MARTAHDLLSMIRRPVAVALLAGLAACAGSLVEDAPERPKQSRIDRRVIPMDVDPIMRGTIAAETIVTGFTPTVVRGYGLVFDLRGTGSRIAPTEVRAQVLKDLQRLRLGADGKAPDSSDLDRLLGEENTAIVVVEGIIPPAAPKGTRFDLRIFAAPGTGATSLEGGRLVLTDLRPGPLMLGSKQPRILARGMGDLVINPFADPVGVSTDTVNRLSGRVLNGGVVTDDMVLRLRLATPSHARAKLIASAINSSFPREPGQLDDTARGRSDEAVDVAIPPTYFSRTNDFVELVRHTPLNISSTEATALQVKRALIANPGAAAAASLRWQALGKKAIPTVQSLYEYAEEQPRFAGLQAGAYLNDPVVVPHLLTMANDSGSALRIDAIKLLANMQGNPRVNIGLRPLIDDTDIDVRLAAFDALLKRGDASIGEVDVNGKYLLNTIGSKKPMIYVTQSGQPRVVIFGDEAEVVRPMTLTEFDSRLVVRGDYDQPLLDVFWQSPDGGVLREQVRPELAEFARFLGHRASPEYPSPGLNMSYSETIGTLHRLWKDGYFKGDFKVEQDRILAELLRTEEEDAEADRPEFDASEEEKDLSAEAKERSGTDSGTDLDRASVGSPVDSQRPSRDTVPR